MQTGDWTTVRGTHGVADPPLPIAILDRYGEPAPTAIDPHAEVLVSIAVPLDPSHETELQALLAAGPVQVWTSWNWWDDDSPDQFERSVLDGAVDVDFHVPPGMLTLGPDGSVVLVE